jgi:sarcosine oxidase
MAYDVLVIGGGVNGLCTLAALADRGVSNAALVEQFAVGHTRGSSHGPSRITRSVYADAAYVRLMQWVQGEEWPRLERAVGRRLVYPAPGCFFGKGPIWDSYLNAVLSQNADVQLLEPAAARTRFPQFRFPDATGVLDDRTAGVLAASATLRFLAQLVEKRGMSILENTRVESIDLRRGPIQVETNRGIIEAERLVVAAGGWASHLLPELKQQLTVVRQSIGYFRLQGRLEDQRAPEFPVWVYVGEGVNEVFYGLPEFETPGVKIGRHRTVGTGDDPDLTPEIAEADVADLRGFLSKQLAVSVEELLSTEHCLYTTTASEDFILDVLPSDPRVVVGSACSGHGFKFGPWTGRVLADLALDGRCDRPEFLPLTARFSLQKSRP